MKKKLPNHSVLISVLLVCLTLLLIFGLSRQKTVVIKTANLNIHSGPGIDYPIIDTTKAQQRYHVIGERNDWYRVRVTDKKYGWVASWLVNRKKPLQHVTRLSEATVVIDPGHGGSDSGAEYKNSKNPQYMEKTYTLQLAKKVAVALRMRGCHVIMTRDNDRYVGLKPRPQLAESLHADAFISFHYDSSPQRNEGTGITAYYYHRGKSKQLASAMSQQFNNLPLTNKGNDFGNFLVIRDNTRPAILCEMGYINTKRDFNHIRSFTYQWKIANDVVKGLNQYLKEL